MRVNGIWARGVKEMDCKVAIWTMAAVLLATDTSFADFIGNIRASQFLLSLTPSITPANNHISLNSQIKKVRSEFNPESNTDNNHYFITNPLPKNVNAWPAIAVSRNSARSAQICFEMCSWQNPCYYPVWQENVPKRGGKFYG